MESELSKQQKKNKKKKEAAKKKKQEQTGAEQTTEESVVVEDAQKHGSVEVEKEKKEGAAEVKEQPKEQGKGEDDEFTKLSPEQQYEAELSWCCMQLELGLQLQKPNRAQKEAAEKALRALKSSKATVVKKRQLMHTMFGDYRAKMANERKQMKKQEQVNMSIHAEDKMAVGSRFLKKHTTPTSETEPKPETAQKQPQKKIEIDRTVEFTFAFD
eukprot:comp26858_c0_seq1/m.47122 comp26858_c0_seq1/g.47122  ORF comp26858_c0_seq1/g.47122 comp26858_c0_seq1/m.47122 type:complete len:214 (-) comp26858_c0_seq1:77-718(-)